MVGKNEMPGTKNRKNRKIPVLKGFRLWTRQ